VAGYLAAAAIIVSFTLITSPAARLLALFVVGALTVLAISRREKLTVMRGQLIYRRASLFGGVGVSAPRSSVLSVRVAMGPGTSRSPTSSFR
jgi:hypothetical protein